MSLLPPLDTGLRSREGKGQIVVDAKMEGVYRKKVYTKEGV